MKIVQTDHPTILKLINSGYSQFAIANHYDVSRARINQILKLYGNKITSKTPINIGLINNEHSIKQEKL